MGVRFEMIVLFVTLLYLPHVSTIVISKLVREMHTKLDHVFSSFSSRSAVDCCSECLKKSDCVAVSYYPDKVCELNSDTVVKYSVDQVNVYYVRGFVDEWVTYKNNTYILVSTERSWQDSEDHCENFGAGSHLVDIHDEEENDFVRGLADGAGKSDQSLWTGMYVTWPSGQQDWTTRIAVDYTKFLSGQPDNHLGLENCVEMVTGGQWNDNYCPSLKLSVCKRPA